MRWWKSGTGWTWNCAKPLNRMAQAADPDFRHRTPPELKSMLDSDGALAEKWQALTPLARNKWICWTISAKQEATREKRRARSSGRQEAAMLLARLPA